jgi:hypothetical protein
MPLAGWPSLVVGTRETAEDENIKMIKILKIPKRVAKILGYIVYLYWRSATQSLIPLLFLVNGEGACGERRVEGVSLTAYVYLSVFCIFR